MFARGKHHTHSWFHSSIEIHTEVFYILYRGLLVLCVQRPYVTSVGTHNGVVHCILFQQTCILHRACSGHQTKERSVQNLTRST